MSEADTRPRVETETFDSPAGDADWRRLARLFGVGLAVGLVVAVVANVLL